MAHEILLTNPEMLTRGILTRAHAEKGPEVRVYGDATEWAYLFKGLRFIVIDELHAFRGVFGAHLANILRRVRRMVELCGGDTDKLRYFACSATIRDPVATGRAVLGVSKVTIIDDEKNGAPHYRRSLVAVDSRGEKLESLAARIIPQISIADNARTIVFRDHIPALAGLHKRLRHQYPGARFELYAAPVVAKVKMDILYRLKSDGVDGILATSALELGIDVGNLNASMLLSYPGTIAKTWQMLGRAGRNGPGLLVYIASQNYLDQYWLDHLDELVGDKAEPEDIVIEPDNPYVVAEHVRGAAYDHVLDAGQDALIRAMRRESITLEKRRGSILRFVEEETLPDYVEYPDEARANQASMRAHRIWNYAALVRAEQLGWIKLGPDVLHEVNCSISPRATMQQLRAIAPTLAKAGLLSECCPGRVGLLRLGEGAAEKHLDVRRLQQEFFDLMLAGKVCLPDDGRVWNTRILVEDFTIRHTARLGEDEKHRTDRQKSEALQVDRIAEYARSSCCRRLHFYRAYGYEDLYPSGGCGNCDVCER